MHDSSRLVELLLVAGSALALGPNPLKAEVVINEILTSTSGSDVEYVELIGPPERASQASV